MLIIKYSLKVSSPKPLYPILDQRNKQPPPNGTEIALVRFNSLFKKPYAAENSLGLQMNRTIALIHYRVISKRA
jgi:hypothetical protein